MEGNVILLRNGLTRKDIFLIHPLGGTLFCFLPLLNLLKIENTIYGIQDPFLSKNFFYYSSIKDMAEQYFYKIKPYIKKDRPIVIGGYSLGGTLAFEIATILESKHFYLDRCLIFDSWPYLPTRNDFNKNLKKIILRQMLQLKLSSFPEYKKLNQKWFDVMENRLKIMKEYKPQKKINAPLVLFRAQEIMKEYSSNRLADYGWSYFISRKSDLLIKKLHGTHETILLKKNLDISFNKEDLTAVRNLFS